MSHRKKIIPSLPDVILRKTFDYLSYRELCQIEAVCKRWQNLIRLKQRKEIHELVVEQVFIKIFHQILLSQIWGGGILEISIPEKSFELF